MSLFLQIVPVSEAVATVRTLATRCGVEPVPLDMALHRVLARDVTSDVDIPGFTRSVMDGYALRAADTIGASESTPAMLSLKGRVSMGAPSGLTVGPVECIYIPTGGTLPEGADAVVMIENTEPIGEEVLVKRPVAHGENIIFYNDDFSAGEIVLSAGRRLSAQDIGVLAAAGCTEVPVVIKPRVGIISTGNELIPVTARPEPGQVRDVNTHVIASVLKDLGCIPVMYGIIRDEREPLSTTIIKAVAECNMILISGGSSKDDRDMVAGIIGELGEVLIHGVAIAPGKPTIIGRCKNIPVIGLPGHPASAFIVLVAIGRHLITTLTGDTASQVRIMQATLKENIPSSRGREDYIRVAVKDGIATPLFGKSGLLNTLVQSTGIVRVPAQSEGLETGTQVEVILW
jgi:molybdopterin molybdotransferase